MAFDFIPPDYLSITVRLLVAALLSGAIGIERETRHQPAGLRTHLLVGTGACLMMILSVTGFDTFIQSDKGTIRFDPSRIPSYVISGIGFLGAGTIIVHRGTVKGLTTAASIWVAAGLGLVVGAGMYFVAVLTTVIVISTLYVLGKLESQFFDRRKNRRISVIADSDEQTFTTISGILEENHIAIVDFQIEDIDSYNDQKVSNYIFTIQEGKIENKMELVKKLEQFEAVRKVNI
ncbi:MgtC/SapB family protein [Planococcus salinus]|uniref:MgtC/SapB family protein n=1 Tax=Planococcus salinus TaxID=1848460 RepID=A0A3M8PA81_9BACL|nr:MgtC/SapB family protein [Planococcus salinus]RNF40301.1 MgtC/SapB family protein [Planococcus salinus]